MHEVECSAWPVDPFVVRHAEEQRARAGAAHALPAEDQKPATIPPTRTAPKWILPQDACGPSVGSSCRAEPAERVAVVPACEPSACMPGVEGMRSIAADNKMRRQAIAEAARCKLEAVNRQQARLAARRASLADRSSIPFVGTYEDNIMCMPLSLIHISEPTRPY